MYWVRWNATMPKPDPKTETRRERFRAECVRRKWYDDERRRWRVTEIANATMKTANKVSDLLNGNGSFGSQIAREIEIALGLPEYHLDSVEQPSAATQDQAVKQVEGKAPDDRERFAGDVIDLLDRYLHSVDEDGRDVVAVALSKFAKNPKGERERSIGILASAMRNPSHPVDPTTPAKPTRKSKASAKVVGKPKLELKVGGGQRRMFALPAAPLQEIMRDEDAPARERDWYKQLPRIEKRKDGSKS